MTKNVQIGFHNNSSELTHLNSGFLGRLRTTHHRQDNKRWQNDCGAVCQWRKTAFKHVL